MEKLLPHPMQASVRIQGFFPTILHAPPPLSSAPIAPVLLSKCHSLIIDAVLRRGTLGHQPPLLYTRKKHPTTPAHTHITKHIQPYLIFCGLDEELGGGDARFVRRNLGLEEKGRLCLHKCVNILAFSLSDGNVLNLRDC